MNIAKKVLAAIASLEQCAAVSLYGGTATDVQNDKHVTFPTGACYVQATDPCGRTTSLVALYPDKSAIHFRWCSTNGSSYEEIPYPLKA